MRKKTGLSKAAVCICIVAVFIAVFNILLMSSMGSTAKDVYEHPYTVSNTARGMRSRLLDMKQFVGMLFTTGFDNEAHSRQLFNERYELQIEAISIIREKYLGPSEDVDKLHNAMNDLIVIQEQALYYVKEGHTDDEVILFIEDKVYPCYDGVSASLDTIINFADRKIASLTKSSTHMAVISVVTTLVLTMALIVLTVHSNRTERSSIRELTAREEELERALTAAEAANNAKKEFLSRMSHEMRTPLNAVLGGVHLAKTREASGLDTKEELERVEQSGQLLLNLINDVLDVSRIEADKIELHNEWCSPMETFRTAVKIVLPMMEKKNIHFIYPKLDTEKETFELLVDAQRMKQVLINLLNNAAKFTPEGGTVTLSAKNISRDSESSTDVIIVSDTGCGMSKEFISRIGEEFLQENNEYSHQNTGSGLGIFIVKKIVETMGGTLLVDSEIGKGSTFRIIIKYKYRQKHTDAKVVKEENVDLSGLQVLCAEDIEINQLIVRQLLEKKGVKVNVVSDGLQALETFRQSAAHTFHAILMDVRMPVMNGMEAAKAIRQLDHPDAKRVPIIAISADAMIEDIRQAMTLGFDEYLTKPIEPQKLYKVLENCINKTRI